MNRSYGILFSEYEMDGCSIQAKLACLEALRRDLGIRYANPDFQFDIVKIVMHSEDNAYPEIGIHCISGNISNHEYEEIEQYVIAKTKEVTPSKVVHSLPNQEVPTWERIIENGSFPIRT
jgi:hypothetical protein